MLKANKIQTVSDVRQYAESYIRQGVGMLAHALNACDDEKLSYRYGDSERDRLENIVIELIDIVERGKVELLAGKYAKQDKTFQGFMKKVTKIYQCGWHHYI